MGGYGASIGTIVGSVAGSYFGPVGTAVGGLVGGLIGGIIDAATRPKPDAMVQEGIKDLSVTSATLGQMIPIIRGKFRVSGNIIEATNKIEHQHEESTESSGGGKGGFGGDAAITIVKTYTVTLAVALCEGPIEKITRVWADLNLVYDETQPLNKIELLSSEADIKTMETPDHAQLFKLFRGTEDQEPSTDLEALHPEGYTPAYRGIAYVVFLNLDLGVTGRIANFTFEVQQSTKDDGIPIDIVVSSDGVYVLTSSSAFFNGIGGITVTTACDVLSSDDADLDDPRGDASTITLISSSESFIDNGFEVGGILSISGEDSDNDGVSATIIEVTGTVITVLADLTSEEAINLTLKQTQQSAMAILGKVTRYTLESVIPVSTGEAGLNPVALSLIQGSLVVVNTGDGEETFDSLSFLAGSSLDSSAALIDLRTAGEILGDIRVGATFAVQGLGPMVFVGLLYVPAITMYIAGDLEYKFRYVLESAPIDAVPVIELVTERRLYVLCANNTVYRLFTNNANMSLDEAITVGEGASHIIAAESDNKIWVSNSGTNTVSHFIDSGDYATVTVGAGPGPLVEASDDYIWVAVGNSVVRVDSVAFTIETFPIPSAITSMARGVNGKIWAASEVGDTVYLIDIDGEYIAVRTPPGPIKIVSDFNGNAYVLCNIGRIFVYIASDASISVSEASPSGLACVVRYVSERSGMLSEEIDVSGLDNSPVNMVLTQIQSALSTLQQLIDIYSFIGVESDGVLHYQFKRGASVATIPENALSGGADKQDNRSLVISRAQERELPTRVSVTYQDPLRNYGSSAQIIQLSNSNVAESPFAVNTALALSAERAKQSAELILYEAWTSRETFAFTMTPMFLLLDPGDIVTVIARSLSHTIRLNEITDGQDWIRQASAVSHNSTIYDDFHVTAPNAGLGDFHLTEVARASLILVDAPPLSSDDVTIRYLLAGYTTQTGRTFVSGSLYRSPDGVTYSFETSTTAQAVVGTITASTPSASQYVWDDTTTILVQLYGDGTLTTSTDTAVLNGANRAMIGNELIGFVNATLLAPRIYSLSRLLRGRNGTESYISGHSANENFVLLSSLLRSTANVLYNINRIDISESYKVVDPSTSIADALVSMRTLYGNSVKPWAPILLDPFRDIPATNDITFRWFHRSRLNDAQWQFAGEVSYDFDDSFGYRVTIYSDNTYSVIKRTILTTSFPFVNGVRIQAYSSAEQISDFGSNQAIIYYGVSSIASIYGYESRSFG